MEEIKKIIEILNESSKQEKKEESSKKEATPTAQTTKKIEDTQKIVNSLITLPLEQNKNKPVVILNPGHGFEDPGCAALDSNNKIVKESYLNQKYVTN